MAKIKGVTIGYSSGDRTLLLKNGDTKSLPESRPSIEARTKNKD